MSMNNLNLLSDENLPQNVIVDVKYWWMGSLTVHISGWQVVYLQSVRKISDSHTLISVARSDDYYFVTPLH